LSRWVYLAGIIDTKAIISIPCKYIRIASMNREFIERLRTTYRIGTIIKSNTGKGTIYIWSIHKANEVRLVANKVLRYMNNAEKAKEIKLLINVLRRTSPAI